MQELDLLRGELTSGDDERAELAVAELTKFGKTAAPDLAELLNDPNPDNRWWAIRALSEINPENLPELLISALQDRNNAVKQCALLAMRNKSNDTYIPHLTALLGNSDSLISSLATDALIAIGEKSAQPLIQILENGEISEKRNAVKALAQIAHYDYDSVSALFKLLDSDSSILSHWASEGLEKMGIGMTFFDPNSS